MTRRNVHDFVTNHGGQFGLAFHLGQQASIDGDLAAGKRPGIGNRIVEHNEFEWQLFAIAHINELGADRLNVRADLWLRKIRAALGLLLVKIVRLTDRDFTAF